MARDSRSKISVDQAVDEAITGQEEWKSMRGSRHLHRASQQFADIASEVVRKGKRFRGEFDVSDKEMRRILYKVTGDSDGYIQFDSRQRAR